MQVVRSADRAEILAAVHTAGPVAQSALDDTAARIDATRSWSLEKSERTAAG